MLFGFKNSPMFSQHFINNAFENNIAMFVFCLHIQYHLFSPDLESLFIHITEVLTGIRNARL